MADLITKSEMARRAGVNPSSIAKAVKPGKDLAEAVAGKMIDAAHPAAIAYVATKTGSVSHAVAPSVQVRGQQAKKEQRKQSAGFDIDVAGLPDNMQDFADMTLREIVYKFGTDYRFVDYLRALKEIEAIEERRIKSAKARGELVSRDLIVKGVIDPLDTAHRKMLTDGAKTIARRAAAMVGAGRDVEDLEKFVAEQITSFIRPAKARVKRTLENVATK